jgi:hypothetical protein
MRKILILVLFSVLCSSCATIFNGHGEGTTVKFTSMPRAAVWVNGEYVDSTPCEALLHNTRGYAVQFQKKGYDTEVRLIQSEFKAGYLAADLSLAAVLPVADYLLGSPILGFIGRNFGGWAVAGVLLIDAFCYGIDAMSQDWYDLDKNHIHVYMRKIEP